MKQRIYTENSYYNEYEVIFNKKQTNISKMEQKEIDLVRRLQNTREMQRSGNYIKYNSK